MDSMAKSKNSPRPMTAELLMFLRTLSCDTAAGRVLNAEGQEIGHACDGYIVVTAYLPSGRRNLKRSHIIWWSVTGKWPERMLDHWDRNRANDAIDNLRLSSSYLNALNSDRCDVAAQKRSARPWEIEVSGQDSDSLRDLGI